MKLIRFYFIQSFLILFFCIFISGCQQGSQQSPKTSIPFEYRPLQDSVLQAIISLEQAGEKDKIDMYLYHKNPAYRYQALHTYTTPRYNNIDPILPLLNDSVAEVKHRAIFAVGQHADKNHLSRLLPLYNPWDSLRQFDTENALILEAVGKCGARNELKQLSSISTFSESDTTLILGQVKGLFQLLLKGVFDENSIDKMSAYFFNSTYSNEIRLRAGYYLFRTRQPLEGQEFALGKILQSQEKDELRVLAAGILANSENPKIAKKLISQLKKERSDQVKVNILRALYKMPYNRVKNAVFNEINNPNPQISRMAARFFLIKGRADDAAQHWDHVKSKKLDPIAKASFAAATAKNLPFYYTLTRNAAIQHITDAIKNTTDVYIQSQLLQILGELPDQSHHIVNAYSEKAHPVIKSQTAFSIQKAAQVAKDTRKHIKTVNNNARKLFDKILVDRDVGALAALANVLRDTSSTNLNYIFRRQNALLPILDSLELPAEIETYNEIAMLLNQYGNKDVSPQESTNFIPFNSTTFQSLTPQSVAKVSTTSGDFTIKLLSEKSPISTVNFVTLAEAGYYDNKVFHRVVPNFVVQTGCHRGDGYGSLAEVIRSELSGVTYNKSGVVGMASAGKDTESSQWFVTLLPVFHLDGRYSIFGEVINGMETVNKITIGDRITSIVILK